jgi:hypothetical protein
MPAFLLSSKWGANGHTEKMGKFGAVCTIAQFLDKKAWLKLNSYIFLVRRAWAKLSLPFEILNSLRYKQT